MMTPIDDRLTPWISALEHELAGDDAALRHDAVADATEHLEAARAELGPDADDAAIAQLVEDFGTPADVAESYRAADRLLIGQLPGRAADPSAADAVSATIDATSGATAPAPTSAPWWGIVRDPLAWSSFVYCLLALPLGIAWFTITITGVAVTLPLLILIIGVPLALAFLAAVRGIALLDGRLVEALLGERMPRRTRSLPGASDLTILARIKGWLTDRRTWTSMAYLVSMLPLGILYFVVAVTFMAVSLAFTMAPIALALSMAFDDAAGGLAVWLVACILVPAGIAGFLGTLHLIRGIGALHGRYAKVMLVGGDGASSRRRPIAPTASFGRALVFLGVLVVIGGATTGASAIWYEQKSEVRALSERATGMTSLELKIDSADITFVDDRSLDAGEIVVDARMEGVFSSQHYEPLLLLSTVGTAATLSTDCSSQWITLWKSCEIDIQIRVAPESGLSLRGKVYVGDLRLASTFRSINVATDVADIEGIASAETIELRTDVGDIELRVDDTTVESLLVTTDVGDIELSTSGTWRVRTSTDVGEVRVRTPTDPSSSRSIDARTDVGDIDIVPVGASSQFDDDDDD